MNFSGARYLPAFVGPDAQRTLVSQVRSVLKIAPLFRPVTPSGKALSVRMSSAGAVGWITDLQGYRYDAYHPNGIAWPAIPPSILEIWAALVPNAKPPQSCLINWYDGDAKMGLHQDRDETGLTHPVVSISLGDAALFRMGGTRRSDKTRSICLNSGDVLILERSARMNFHGIDRVKHHSSTLFPKGGRINLTLRVIS